MDERIAGPTDLGHGRIHSLSNFITFMTSEILAERIAEKAAARALCSSSKPVGSLKDIVRYRHRSFHTKSITANRMGGKY